MILAVRDNSIHAFLEQAGDLLYQHEPVNSLMLGICESMSSPSYSSPKDPLFVRLIENDQTVSAVIQTPPMGLVITYASPKQLAELASFLKDEGILSIPSVVGPAEESAFFAGVWSSITQKEHQLGMSQKIYKLEKVDFPSSCNGHLRAVQAQEFDLVFRWITAFAKESLPASDQREELYWKEYVERAIQNQSAHFWIQEGRPVSLAFTNRPTQKGISISGVYTPSDLRKKGHASHLVAHLSQKMLDAGKDFCVLYTDLDNPTSNRIYQNIGYHEVASSKYFVFS